MLRVRRKWGWYRVLVSEKDYKVKILCLSPRQKTSIQKHRKRSEILVFARDGFTTRIGKNEWHQIKNESDKKLYIVETQIGKCIERDIERKQEK